MKVPILLYHQIATPPAKGAPFRSMYVSPASFRRQMWLLRRLGFQGLSLREAMPFIRGEKTGKVAAITFDDGFCNVHANALPVLQEFGFTATNFFVANQTGGSNEWDRPLGIAHAACMDERQIEDWLAAGNEVGSHSLDHRHLTAIGAEEARRQILSSKFRLEQITRQPVTSFSYPYGDCSPSVRSMVKDAGYAVATGTDKRRAQAQDDMTELPRWTIRRGDTLLHFLLKCLVR